MFVLLMVVELLTTAISFRKGIRSSKFALIKEYASLIFIQSVILISISNH